MGTDVSALRLDVDELTRRGGLLAQLEALIAQPVADPTVGTTSKHKVTGSPAPWNVEVAAVLMEVHAGARELEDDLRARLAFTRQSVAHGLVILRPAGPPGTHGPGRPVRWSGRGPRGASAANTAASLRAIPDLAAKAGDPHATGAARLLARWCREAREVRDIDTSERWVPVPRLPGTKVPACPYCLTYALRMQVRAGVVRCTNPECRDPDGHRPKAHVAIGQISQEGVLVFRDGAQVNFTLAAQGTIITESDAARR